MTAESRTFEVGPIFISSDLINPRREQLRNNASHLGRMMLLLASVLCASKLYHYSFPIHWALPPSKDFETDAISGFSGLLSIHSLIVNITVDFAVKLSVPCQLNSRNDPKRALFSSSWIHTRDK